MSGKITKVELECPAHSIKQTFELSHAERLLSMNNNGGWQLPENSKFEFSKQNGIKFRTNKKTAKGAAEEVGD